MVLRASLLTVAIFLAPASMVDQTVAEDPKWNSGTPGTTPGGDP
jgi:hypothetical protein